MKKVYLLLLICLPAFLQAQVRITAENSPQIGNRLIYQVNSAASNISPGSAGQGQTWDFTGFMPLSRETISVVRPDNIPGRDSFPSANLVFSSGDGVNFSFGLSTDTAFFSLGSFLNTNDSSTAAYTILEEPRTEIIYPTEFGTQFEILVRNRRNLGVITPGTTLITIEEERILNEADAEGTMQLPQGEFSVLRIKQSRSRIDSTFFETESGRQFINATSSQSISYEWYSEAARGPLVTLDEPIFGPNNPFVSVLDLENSQLSDSTEVTVEVPIADFDTVAIDRSTYFFLNRSQNEPTSWSWNFGDGNTSNTPNVQHQYTAGGTYEVCLEVSNSAGLDTTCKTLSIERLRPIADFSLAKGEAGVVSFTNFSTGDDINYIWDFGDGNSSTEASPTHQYTEEGSFEVCLTASNTFGSDSKCEQVLIDDILPTADFSFQNSSPGQFSFTNLSSANTDSLAWDFGDGNTSDVEQPIHQYQTEGNFTVCLVAYNALGTDTLCQNLSVDNLLPEAAFSFEEQAFGLFSFSDDSQNAPDSWQWSFGDGSSSTVQNPSHQYQQDGNYTVRLVIENAFGADSTEQILNVSGLQTTAGFDIDLRGQGLFRFLNLSSNNSTDFSWDFDDGNRSTEENPEHQYITEGFFTVCLVAANAFTSDTLCTEVQVDGLIPEAGFSISSIEADSIQLIDTSNNFPTEWLWTFGDGDSSQVQNPRHRYAVEGIYEVCLTAKNRFGQDSTCQNVELIFVSTQSEWMRSYLELAPNPFQDELRLKWVAPNTGHSWQYQIFNTSGELLQRGALQASQYWPTSNWPPGTYWLQIIDRAQGKQLTIPVIKQ